MTPRTTTAGVVADAPNSEAEPVPIRQEVENAGVAYSMNVAVLRIESPDSRLVQLKNGSFERMEVPEFTLELDHEGRAPTTRYYDPTDPEDAAFIEKVDAWIASGDKRVKTHQVYRVTSENDAPAAPFPNWDKTSAKRIAEIVREQGYDVRHCVLYEVRNQNRDSVVHALEKLAGEQRSEEQKAERTAAAGDLRF